MNQNKWYTVYILVLYCIGNQMHIMYPNDWHVQNPINFPTQCECNRHRGRTNDVMAVLLMLLLLRIMLILKREVSFK